MRPTSAPLRTLRREAIRALGNAGYTRAPGTQGRSWFKRLSLGEPLGWVRCWLTLAEVEDISIADPAHAIVLAEELRLHVARSLPQGVLP